MRPLLKWAGGKSKLAGQISGAFGGRCRGRWIEPFIGSASVFLYRRAKGEIGDALLADVNPKLVAMHVAVRDEVDDVITELARLPVASGWESVYAAVRDDFNDGPWVGPRHAARFLWLNRAGFNGLYRENRRGHFNVPVGRYATLAPPTPAHLREVSGLLQGTEIVCSGFADVMRRAGPADHVYCDPPYVPLNATAAFTNYAKDPFGLEEQVALAASAMRAALRGACVVLSNHDLPIVRNELYPEASGFRVHARPEVGRPISRSASTRKPITEVIAAIGPLLQVA